MQFPLKEGFICSVIKDSLKGTIMFSSKQDCTQTNVLLCILFLITIKWNTNNKLSFHLFWSVEWNCKYFHLMQIKLKKNEAVNNFPQHLFILLLQLLQRKTWYLRILILNWQCDNINLLTFLFLLINLSLTKHIAEIQKEILRDRVEEITPWTRQTCLIFIS